VARRKLHGGLDVRNWTAGELEPAYTDREYVEAQQSGRSSAECQMSDGSVLAVDARVLRSPIRQALDMAKDLSLAVILVWSLPLAFGIAVASVRTAVQFLTR